MADINNKPHTDTTTEAQQPAQVTDASPAGAAQPRPCPQDCSQCSTPQHIFCSAKMLFDLSRAMNEQRRQQAELAQTVADIQEQLKQKDKDVLLSIPFDGGE